MTDLHFSIENAGIRGIAGREGGECGTGCGTGALAANVTIAHRCCIRLRYRGGDGECGVALPLPRPVRGAVAGSAVPAQVARRPRPAAGLTFVCPRAPRPARLVLFHSAAGGGRRAAGARWPRDGPRGARCGTDVASHLRRRGESRRQGQKSGRRAPTPGIATAMSSAEMGKFNISPDEDSSSYSSNSNDYSYPYPTKPAMKR